MLILMLMKIMEENALKEQAPSGPSPKLDTSGTPNVVTLVSDLNEVTQNDENPFMSRFSFDVKVYVSVQGINHKYC